ncbi:MAG: PKD domain-containing protein [Saprospiraceae bacterium]|nr:PKD domain-containing protein [Saprospiraceae bacterium]MCF8248315.1 PKD domain-containing protein [Saprospiraceae bacterium]MCF8280246.1 PKD domain-containing protein [Bacteroidales bacterium]MCF8309843.1 PKD domain-containing protein [Saprospiraceae bacterium]MCF8438826.1 PKD domain-containing protein [Saprospiraceae bacterium]
MSKINTLTLSCLFVAFTCMNLQAQVNFTANNQVSPYPYGFHPAANIGQYTSFSEEQLALLAAGGLAPTSGNVLGAGVKSLRPGIFESFVEVAGYDANLPAFQKYAELGMGEHTVIVGFPSDEHRDPTQYCQGIQSTLFDNMYSPIWDGGANGTPYNDSNYYAAYLYKTVSMYKDFVRFWEIWNEPGFDYTGGLGFLPPGAPGSWWDNNPNPCDYKLRAPIFNYVRLLRISWEIIKTIDPDAYVVVSGTGYPSFLDAILRNSDNPVNGAVTADYPLKGGAYFDVMGFHSYPHFDGGLREYSDSIQNWVYSRHSDAAAGALLKTKNAYQAVLDDYGYNSQTYPEKLWIITEVNLPRKQFPEPGTSETYIGSAIAQRNFMIKAMTTCMANDILQMQVYKLAEDTKFENAYSEFDLMGLYKKLDYNQGYFQTLNDEGVAHKTGSDILFGKTFDPIRTAQMQLPATVGGGAFKDEFENYTYTLWAKTHTDLSEVVNATYSFPASLNISNLLKCEWDASISHDAVSSPSVNIALTATPIFLNQRIFTLNNYSACAPFQLQLTSQVSGASQWAWTILTPSGVPTTFNTQNPSMTLTTPGNYTVSLQAKNAGGQIIAEQSQTLFVTAQPAPIFTTEVTGPIVYFHNQTSYGLTTFTWNFGDGTTSTNAVPTHVYLLSGNYNVTLTATNECGSVSISHPVSVVSPNTTQLDFTANDSIPSFTGKFRPGTSWDYLPGWTSPQLGDIAAGNPLAGASGVKGAGVKAIRTYTGESAFLDLGYDTRVAEFEHFNNLDLRDNSFLLAFPASQNRDPYHYCPDLQSALFKDLYLNIWDNGENGTPVNDANPFALYVWNTVNTYKDYVRFWEIYNSPDFDLTGDKAWLPPGEPGNWWQNNPDPCDYELKAPIFYYVRSLRIAYEIVRFLDPDAYVTISGIAYPSFLDAVCRNTDNPLDGSVQTPYPQKGGAYFDAVGYKSYPHFDGSTQYFDVSAGQFAYERHSDAAVSGIPRVKSSFQQVLSNYGYDGTQMPEKEWIISEANLPRQSFYGYLGSAEAQRNWIIKAWVESVRDNIRQLNIFRLAESQHIWLANDAFEVMGLYQKMEGVTPYNQTVNDEGIALKTCSDLLFGTDYNQQRTEAMNLPTNIGGASFSDASGKFVYVLWAKTESDQTENANATYSFPTSLGIGQLQRRLWNHSQTGQVSNISPNSIALTGAPIFLRESNTLMPPVAFFEADFNEICVNETVQFSSLVSGNPTNWEWAFVGGTPASHIGQTPPPISYFTAGVYEVKLKVSNAAGEHEATYSNFITVQPAATANFMTVVNGATVQFVNLSIDPMGLAGTQFEWCYGDGICQMAANPSYVFFQNGTYTVTLTATNNCGTASYEQTITIGAAPTAVFGFNHNGDCAAPVVQFLDNSYSNPESWYWFFPGATPAETDLRYPTVSFPQTGFYEVTFIVGNGFGVDTLVRQVYIEGNSTTEIDVSVCQGGFYKGIQIFSDTTVTIIYPTWTLSCDSSIVAHVAVTDHLETVDEYSRCEGEVFHGVQVFSDTVFVETFNLPIGCDSISTSNLTVFPNESTVLFDTIAPGEFVEVGGLIFTQNGVFEVPLQTVHGCDSLVTLYLTVLTGTRDLSSNPLNVKAFPNPFSQQLTVEFELPETSAVDIRLFDAMGRQVQTLVSGGKMGAGQHKITLENLSLSAGVYWLKMSTSTGNSFFKLIKT